MRIKSKMSRLKVGLTGIEMWIGMEDGLFSLMTVFSTQCAWSYRHKAVNETMML